MLALANAIAWGKAVKIDRDARRSKECLICWFCENVPEIIGNPAAAAAILTSPAPAMPAPAHAKRSEAVPGEAFASPAPWFAGESLFGDQAGDGR
jgi:hypothetical protein